MRLTCPNCSARYEVDESMIPAVGRDVQCSNCGTTWFQPGPRGAAPEEPATPEPEVAADPAPEPEVAEPDPAPEPEPEPEAPDPEPEPVPTPERPQRRQIEPAVADILREEAERETQLRRAEAEAAPVETQSEMPLETSDEQARMRRLAELDDAEDAFDATDAAVAAAAAGSRSELLPDIEEINSTLRATGDRSEAEADATDADTVGSTARRRGSVRRGFFLVVLLALIAVLVYAQADAIAAAVPQIAPALDTYVDLVNSARFQLDELARGLASGSAE